MQTKNLILAGLVAFSSFNTSQARAEDARSCESRILPTEGAGSDCQQWASTATTSPILERFDDGTMVPNPLTLESGSLTGDLGRLAKMPTTDTAKINRLRGTAQSLVESMRLQIRDGKADSELNGHQRYLLDRLANINIVTDGSGGDCSDTPFNATYEQTTNSMILCPILAQMPPEAYVSLVAHELGHLADPCNAIDRYRFAGPLASTNEARLPGAIASATRSCLREVPRRQVDAFIQWSQSPNRAGTRSYPVYAGINPYRPLTERMVACGNATRPESLVPPTYGGHPYFPVLSCVGGYPFENPVADDPAARAKIGRNQDFSNWNVPLTPIEANDHIQSPRHPLACDSNGPGKETTADFVGASLLRFHLERVPTSVRPERRRYLTFFQQSVHCAEKDRQNGTYLRSRDRLMIFLQAVGPQLGCAPESSNLACSIMPTDGGRENQRPTQIPALASRTAGSSN